MQFQVVMWPQNTHVFWIAYPLSDLPIGTRGCGSPSTTFREPKPRSARARCLSASQQGWFNSCQQRARLNAANDVSAWLFLNLRYISHAFTSEIPQSIWKSLTYQLWVFQESSKQCPPCLMLLCLSSALKNLRYNSWICICSRVASLTLYVPSARMVVKWRCRVLPGKDVPAEPSRAMGWRSMSAAPKRCSCSPPGVVTVVVQVVVIPLLGTLDKSHAFGKAVSVVVTLPIMKSPLSARCFAQETEANPESRITSLPVP